MRKFSPEVYANIISLQISSLLGIQWPSDIFYGDLDIENHGLISGTKMDYAISIVCFEREML